MEKSRRQLLTFLVTVPRPCRWFVVAGNWLDETNERSLSGFIGVKQSELDKFLGVCGFMAISNSGQAVLHQDKFPNWISTVAADLHCSAVRTVKSLKGRSRKILLCIGKSELTHKEQFGQIQIRLKPISKQSDAHATFVQELRLTLREERERLRDTIQMEEKHDDGKKKAEKLRRVSLDDNSRKEPPTPTRSATKPTEKKARTHATSDAEQIDVDPKKLSFDEPSRDCCGRSGERYKNLIAASWREALSACPPGDDNHDNQLHHGLRIPLASYFHEMRGSEDIEIVCRLSGTSDTIGYCVRSKNCSRTVTGNGHYLCASCRVRSSSSLAL